MKRYMRARVTLLGDYVTAMPGNHKKPFEANVFMNGSAAVINTRPIEPNGSDERFDRILDATLTTVDDSTVQISGRSEYLAGIGMILADQQVAFQVKGGKCENC